jgi:Domain of unknown function (DUF1877)
MGMILNIIEIDSEDFQKYNGNPLEFNYDAALSSISLEKNYDGIRYLLNKYDFEGIELLGDKIINPHEVLGGPIDFDSLDLENYDDLDKILDQISFISNTDVKMLNSYLKDIDKTKLLDLYHSKELNTNDIYPAIWHDDESEDLGYNRRHIENGFDRLFELYAKVANNSNFICLIIE